MQESLLQKAVRTGRARGLRPLAHEIWEYAGRHSVAMQKMLGRSAMRAATRLDAHERDVATLLDFVCKRFAGLLRPAQVRSEITSLAAMVKDLKPARVLEIGTARGGTLFLWSRLADPSATVVSVDLPGGEYGGGYAEWRTSLYRSFRLPGQAMHLLRANSHAAETVKKVRSIFGGSPVDFLFIDGDHSYDGVRKDFEQYAPLVRKGGLIALHDVAVHPPEMHSEVDRFWNEIKTPNSQEFIENRDQGWAGIGVYPVV